MITNLHSYAPISSEKLLEKSKVHFNSKSGIHLEKDVQNGSDAQMSINIWQYGVIFRNVIWHMANTKQCCYLAPFSGHSYIHCDCSSSKLGLKYPYYSLLLLLSSDYLKRQAALRQMAFTASETQEQRLQRYNTAWCKCRKSVCYFCVCLYVFMCLSFNV